MNGSSAILVLAAITLVAASPVIAGQCAPIKGSQLIQSTPTGSACIAGYQQKLILTTKMNDKQRAALTSFASDVGCQRFGRALKKAHYQLKHLPRQMLHVTSSASSQQRRNAEVALFLQPVSCASGAIFTSSFNPANLPPHTQGPVIADATDTGRVTWKRRAKQPVALAVSSNDGIGAPCPKIKSFVIASTGYCCPAKFPVLIGLLCYEKCPSGFHERGFGCYPDSQTGGSGWERPPKLSKWKPKTL